MRSLPVVLENRVLVQDKLIKVQICLQNKQIWNENAVKY